MTVSLGIFKKAISHPPNNKAAYIRLHVLLSAICTDDVGRRKKRVKGYRYLKPRLRVKRSRGPQTYRLLIRSRMKIIKSILVKCCGRKVSPYHVKTKWKGKSKRRKKG